MWACAKGYTEAAQTLYHWNRGPLKVCNKDGILPLTAARHHGHHNLANCIELLEQTHNNQKTLTPRTTISVPDTVEPSGGSGEVSSTISDTFLAPDNVNTVSSSGVIACEQSNPFPSAISTTSDDSGNDSLFAGTSSPPLPPPPPPPPPPPYPGNSKLVRRMSEQCLGSSSSNSSGSNGSSSGSGGGSGGNSRSNSLSPQQKSNKRYSVDFVSPKRTSVERNNLLSDAYHKPVRESISEPHLSSFFKTAQQQQPLLSASSQGMDSSNQIPDMLMHTDTSLGTEHLSSTDSIMIRGPRRQSSDNHLLFSMDTGKDFSIFLFNFTT